MATAFRSQRLLQRLSSATSRSNVASRQSFLPPSQNVLGTCVACQLRSQSSVGHPSQARNILRQTRRFASTSSSSTGAEASETKGNNGSGPGAPDISNYYTIFSKTLPAGPPPSSPFDISLGDLRREFLQLQNVSHPDKYPQGPAKQRAEALSTLINEAYRTLVDPLPRAQYLLREMHGIDVTAEDGAAKHALDPATLMDVMEVQETIEEVSADPDAEEKITQLKKENAERVDGCVKELAGAFDRGDIETARQECVRLRFWYNVGEGLKEWEPGMTEIRLVH